MDRKKACITVYKSIGGWKAVMVIGWEPEMTGCGAYETREEAEDEAREWADAEGLEFIP